jgi:hypothetical protein
MDEVAWWQRVVHAEIAAKFGPPFEDWRWPLYAGLCMNIPRVTGWRHVAHRLGQSLSPWARAANFAYRGIGLFHSDNPAEPLAIAIYLPATKNLRLDGPGILYLEWFSAQSVGMHGHENTVGFGQYLMDWLILQSMEAGLEGRISLHAASEGLCRVYELWGFEPVGTDVPLIRNRRNNGLFYELRPNAAFAFRERLDHLR